VRVSLRHSIGRAVGFEPLSADQARLLVAANPGPVLVAEVTADDHFRVVASGGVFSRIVTGAAHPAGPHPGEILPAAGFGLLGVDLAHSAHTGDRVVTEVPVGDEPRWFEMVVTPIVVDRRTVQLLVIGTDRTAEHDVEARQRRAARRFEAMVDHAPGLVMLVDSSARILRASPNAASSLQLDGELVGRQLFELAHPDTLHHAAAAFGEILIRPGEPVAIDDFRLVRRSGATMWCEATATNLLHDDDVAAIVINATDVTQRRIAEERLAIAVTRDEATGLANRRALDEHLRSIVGSVAATGGAIGLAIVALDGLSLADTADGSDSGATVTSAVSGRIARLAGAGAFIARPRPDQLAVVVERSGEADAMRSLAELASGIHGALREGIVVGDDEILVRAAIGTAVSRPDPAAVTNLFRSAELAAMRAGAAGPDTTVAFTEEIRQAAESRLRQVTELQRAMRTERLRLAYQPMLDRAGTIVGAEALLRWERNGELLTPGAFLSLAEETGLIVPIGAWVVDRACADAAAMARTVPNMRWVSVNVSAQQLRDERFPALVHRAMDDHGIHPHGLALEFDDDAVIDALPHGTPTAMAQLTDVSMIVSCRDLAGDQRILDRLGDFPITALKLDRHLVGQLDVEIDGLHAALVGATVDLARELGVEVIAQGVETEAQARRLRALGVDTLQGFHFAPPMDLASLLTRARARSHQRS
jgi:PAS domain S-box-containing protein/diguanylate cyclase (GGDEF)-like protein